MPASTAIRQDLHAVRRAAGLAGAPRPMGPEDTDGHASFWAAFDAPEPPNPEEKGKPKPREARKSFRWVEGLRDCAEAAERLGETRVVCTMDREADFLDLFIERRTHAPQAIDHCM